MSPLPLRIGSAALLLSLPVALSAQGTPPRRPPTFGTGIEVIRLHVTVTEGNRYVTGRSTADFTVFEDGVRQELAFFQSDPLPISLSLLLDCSASMDEKLPVAQAAAARLIRTLTSRDLGQVVQFSDNIALLQDFTSDRRRLEQAIRGTTAGGSTALYNALYVAIKQLRAQGDASDLRRRAIVLLSDGEDTSSLVSDEQLLELARNAEIAIYTIGLQSDRVADRSRMSMSQANHFLTALARETGGQSFFPRSLSELDGVYDRIGTELRSQYTLGYVSANTRRDGQWRRIVVRTPARDDLQVRHKMGYYAPRG